MTTDTRLSVLIYRANVLPAPDHHTEAQAHTAQEINRAAREGAGNFLALVPAGSHLPEGLLPRCLAALDLSPATLAVYPAHTAGDAAARPLITQGPFRAAALLRRNPVGPMVMIRRSVWQELGGLRTGLSIPMALWDFWLRLALAHPEPASIRRLPELLAHCPPLTDIPAAGISGSGGRGDGKAKALLVVHTPGAFEGDVCRWALALLRGEPWARPHAPGLIPTAAEVRRMWETGRVAARSGSLRQSA